MFASKLVVLIVGLSSMGAPAERPPELTFEKHVDYIGWWKRNFASCSGENAYKFYKPIIPDNDGSGGMPSLKGAAKEDYERWDPGVWDASEYPELAAYLNAVEPHLAAVERACSLKYYCEPFPDDIPTLYELRLPLLSLMRDVSRSLFARAWLKQDRQAAAILNAARISLRMADHAEQQPWVISGLVGLAIRALTYDTVLAALDKRVIADSEIQGVYEVMKSRDPGPINLRTVVVANHGVALDAMQSVCSNGNVNLDKWTGLGGSKVFDPKEAYQSLSRKFETDLEFAEMPLNSETLRMARAHYDQNEKLYREKEYFRVTSLNVVRPLELTIRTESYRRGTMIALALYAHHAKHGEWPKRLKDLDKDLGLQGYRSYGKDPFTGKLFRYKLVDGKPLLYSIGADDKDDGGRHDTKWGENEGGGDFVFVPDQV